MAKIQVDHVDSSAALSRCWRYQRFRAKQHKDVEDVSKFPAMATRKEREEGWWWRGDFYWWLMIMFPLIIAIIVNYCQLLSIIVIIITIIVIIITSINYKIRRRRRQRVLLLLLFDVIIIILILLFDGHVAVYRIVPVSVGLTSGMRISKVNALEERAQKVIMKSKRRAPCSSIQLHHGYHIQLERPKFGDTRTGELDSNWTSLRSLSVLQTVVFASALPQSREGAFDASGCSPLKMRSRLAFRTCI